MSPHPQRDDNLVFLLLLSRPGPYPHWYRCMGHLIPFDLHTLSGNWGILHYFRATSLHTTCLYDMLDHVPIDPPSRLSELRRCCVRGEVYCLWDDQA
jgi:hypothetical protein